MHIYEPASSAFYPPRASPVTTISPTYQNNNQLILLYLQTGTHADLF